jgi:hypothetical protein
MSTSAAPVATRQQLETALIEKCWKDPAFRKEVVSDPKGMLEKHLGRELPEQECDGERCGCHVPASYVVNESGK